MKKDSLYYVILVILTLIDAWLLAHPNLIGRMGILFYKYDMIKTLPRAFGTVFCTVLVAILMGYLIESKLKKPVSTIAISIFVVASLSLTVQNYFKFSSGTYALTGAGFKTGAVLLPIILLIVFGKSLIEIIKKSHAEPQSSKEKKSNFR